MAKSPTKPSTPKLSEIARHVVAPKGVVSTGWPAVEAKCADLGIRFRPWQPDVGRLILAKRSDGKYAATVGGTGLSIPRQVGKTFLVGAIVFALCLLRPNLTVIWTAHRLRTAEETFGKMLAFAKRKRIAPHILKTPLGSGDEAIIFRNGSRILFGARERGFGRGFDEVDVLIFDEAQILTENALDDMVPATNQSRQETSALLLFMGTPPKPSDPGEVFTRMRTEALTGEDDDTGWVEFGADEDFEPTPAPSPLTEADWRQVAKANPSYPQDTPREAILRMRKKLGPESFLREGLGIWPNLGSAGKAFGPGMWEGCRVSESVIVDQLTFAVAVSIDRRRFCIAASGLNAGGRVHVELTHEVGSDRTYRPKAVVAECKRLQVEHGGKVVIDTKGPGSSLIPDLRAASVDLVEADTSDVCDAYADLYDRVQGAEIAHLDDPELNSAVVGAKARPVGDRSTWGRKLSTVDISPLEAVTLAAWPVEKKPVEVIPSVAYR